MSETTCTHVWVGGPVLLSHPPQQDCICRRCLAEKRVQIKPAQAESSEYDALRRRKAEEADMTGRECVIWEQERQERKAGGDAPPETGSAPITAQSTGAPSGPSTKAVAAMLRRNALALEYLCRHQEEGKSISPDDLHSRLEQCIAVEEGAADALETAERERVICRGEVKEDLDGKPLPGNVNDGTDAACPGWWRAHDYTTEAVANKLRAVADTGERHGVSGSAVLEAAAQSILALRQERDVAQAKVERLRELGERTASWLPAFTDRSNNGPFRGAQELLTDWRGALAHAKEGE